MANYEKESGSFTYDVFISFRGEDTRNTFIGYLREELKRKGIKIFADDDIRDMRMGEGISPSLSKAIEESKIYIIVLSENYASSTWCLRELVEILDCKKRNNKRHVLPIFYHVYPSDVRHHQENSYGEAIRAHETRIGENSEEVKAWKSALYEVANLKGLHITSTSGYENNFIEKIAKIVLAQRAPKTLHVGQNLIGLEHRIEEVMSLLDIKFEDDTVSMLGIYGLGGVGKTEIAKALYNKIVDQFESASFLENVREKSKNINGLEDLQKTLLSEMFEELETELGSTSKGIEEIKCKLNKKKVLLVLDDIDDREQLNNLAGECEWFGLGSRIIITTRDKDLLGHPVKKAYEMIELDNQDSLKLFCMNAFRKSHPETGYEDMSSCAVGYAKGLPLALKVIGSDLATQESLEDWECAMNEYQSAQNARIFDKLKISYDRLEGRAKSVFLDIACFFRGARIEYVEEVLEEFNATHNIKVLINKSLLTVEYGCLKMHDLIQDMGREIVKREAPNLGNCSRLWFYEDVLNVLAEDSGSDAIQGIMLDPPQQEIVQSGIAFKKMKHLRILIVRNTLFASEPIYLPSHLRLLDWEGYPSKSFPPEFYPKKIVVLNLRESNLKLEEPFKDFSNLTTLDFSHNQSIIKIPDLSSVRHLKKLKLESCMNLIEVHESVGFLKRLVLLNAFGCIELINFPRRMFLPSLELLNLNSCVKLEHFPDIVNKMNKPLKIHVSSTAIKELPDSIDNLTGVVCIEISGSKKLKNLPSSFFKLQNIVTFDIGECCQLRESFKKFIQSPHPTLRTLDFEKSGLLDNDLHVVLKCFPKLEEITASGNNFVSLPECIKESFHLTRLDVRACQELQNIPECTNLKILNVHSCMQLQNISKLPSTIQIVDASYCFSLSRDTTNMLWSQVRKEIYGLKIMMPQTNIPEWFDFRDNSDKPYLWVYEKFPIIALALVFRDDDDIVGKFEEQLVELQLDINGQRVPRQGYYNFNIAKDHVLICDLRLLFSNEEWLGLNAFLKPDWNLVEVSYNSSMTLGCWGVFVYKQGTKMEDVQFTYTSIKPRKTLEFLFSSSSSEEDEVLVSSSLSEEDWDILGNYNARLAQPFLETDKLVNQNFHRARRRRSRRLRGLI